MSEFDYDKLKESGHTLYSIEYDLIHDIERKGRNVLDVFHQLSSSGEIVECEVDFDAVGTLDCPIGNRLPLRLVFATTLTLDEIGSFLPLNKTKVKVISAPDLTVTNRPVERKVPTQEPAIAGPPTQDGSTGSSARG